MIWYLGNTIWMYNLCSEKNPVRGKISVRAEWSSLAITANYYNVHVASVTSYVTCLFYYQHPKYRANHILRACKNLSRMSGAWELFYAKQVVGTPYLFDTCIQAVFISWEDSSCFLFFNYQKILIFFLYLLNFRL